MIKAIEQALDKAEARILQRARRAWKPIQRQFLEQAEIGTYSLIDIPKLAEAFKIGMFSAYVYGRISIKGYLKQVLKRQAKKRQAVKKQAPGQDVWAKYWKLLWRNDRAILEALARSKKVDPMSYYFKPSPRIMAFLDSYTVQLARVIEQDVLKQTTIWIKEAMEQGLSARERFKYLQQRMRGFSENRLKMIARTEATRAFNIGTIEESRTADVIVGYRFDAVLDKRTSEICRARDGKFIPKDDTELLIQNTPPLHVNCRSRLEPLTQYDELPRSHMPKTWDNPNLLAKQREYDRQVLRNLFSAPTPAPSEWTINDAIDALKALNIPVKNRYTKKEVEAMVAAIDPDHPRGVRPPVMHVRSKKFLGRYQWRGAQQGLPVTEETIKLNSSGYRSATVYHEILHRQHIGRFSMHFIDKPAEEGTVEFLAEYLVFQTHPNVKFIQVSYVEWTARIAVEAHRHGLDNVVRTLWYARRHGMDWDNELLLKMFSQPVQLYDVDFQTIAIVAKQNSRLFRRQMRELYTRGGTVDLDKKFVNKRIDKMYRIASNAEKLQKVVEEGAIEGYYVLAAFVNLVARGLV